MFSDRTPESLAPNAWTERRDALARQGVTCVDLAQWDPARAGLAPLVRASLSLAAVGVPAQAPDPLGSGPARAAVARVLAEDGLHAEPEAIALTPSTSESYAHLFRLFCRCGEALAAPLPTYPLFEPIAAAEGVRLRHYRLAWDGVWHLDRDSVRNALAEARALLVVEPAFPTGAVLPAADREWLLEACAERGIPIVADEVFRTPATPGRSWADGAPATLVVSLGGLSKACGLPQLKLAWAVFAGPAPGREEAVRRFGWLEDLFLGVASPVQAALPELLELRHEFRGNLRRRLAANDASLEAWRLRFPEASFVPAGESWAQPIRLPGRRGADGWALAALDQGVVVHSGDPFELAPGSHVVVSRLVEEAEFGRGLAALGRALAS